MDVTGIADGEGLGDADADDVADGEAAWLAVGDGAGDEVKAGLGVAEGMGVATIEHDDIARFKRVDAIASGSGAARVALSERPRRLHDDARMESGRRCRDDDSQRSAAVVDREADAVRDL